MSQNQFHAQVVALEAQGVSFERAVELVAAKAAHPQATVRYRTDETGHVVSY